MEFQGASAEQILRLQKHQRHSMEIFTPEKMAETNEKMSAHDGLIILRQLYTQRAYERLKSSFMAIGKQFDILPSLKKVYF